MSEGNIDRKCEFCDHEGADVEAVKMSMGSRKHPPEHAYMCEECRERRAKEHGRQAEAERRAERNGVFD